MERRSWPWRRKLTEKATQVSPSVNVSDWENTQPSVLSLDISSGPQDSGITLSSEQDTSQNTENAQVMEAVLQWQQAEKKVTILTEKLAAAMSDNADKGEVVKQQRKVAENAVSRWQRAESEALDFKQQLEVSRQEKIAADGRVNHMDDALKECLRQIRHLREEQEERVQEAIMKKSKEWEKVRTELEAKKSELSGQLLELGAENNAMSKSLQERARTILEVNEAKARAESEVKVLQVRLECSEKDMSSLKYEIHVLNKELEIRNEDREYSKRSAAAAHRQHLENVKKIAKLESECQRLRTLVRKKLPGPAAGRMKMEVDSFRSGRETWEGRRRRGVPIVQLDSWQERSPGKMNKVEMLTDRLLAMEEEASLLKEALAKRNAELHVAKQMCARTISKLTIKEQHGQIEEQSYHSQKIVNLSASGELISLPDVLSTTGPSLASRSEDDGAFDDEASCAESWASALIAELAQFKKVKPVASSRNSVDSCNLDIVDDVGESEPFALPPNASDENQESTNDPVSMLQCVTEAPFLASRIIEFQTSSCQMFKNVLKGLSVVEENLSSLKDANAENEALLRNVQVSLKSVDEARQEISKLENVLDEERMGVPLDANGMKDEAGSPGSCARESVSGAILEVDDPLSESTASINVHAGDILLPSPRAMSSARSILYKIVQLIEILAPMVVRQIDPGSVMEENSTDREGSNLSSSVIVERQTQSLIFMKNKLSEDKLDIMEYLLQLAVVLSCISGLDVSELEKLLTKLSSSNTTEEVEKLVVSNNVQLETASGLQVEEGIPTDTDNQNFVFQEEANTEILRANLPRMESGTLVESVQRDLDMVKEDKGAVERKLDDAEKEIQGIRSKLAETELFVSALQQKLASAESREQVERDLADATASKTELTAELQDAKLQIEHLSEKVTSLTSELEDEQRQHKETVTKCDDLEHQLKELMKGSSQQELLNSCRSIDDDTKTIKEQGMVAAKEKLAECQRSILVLEKQLNALTASDPVDTSSALSIDDGLNEHRSVPTVDNAEFGCVGNPLEMDRRKAQSGLMWSRSDRRFLEQESFKRGYVSGSLDTEFYKAQQHANYPAAPYYNRNYNNSDLYNGNGIHSPIQECIERSSFVISPPDTAKSSPAVSPARFVQYQEKRSGNAVQVNLTKSMNKVVASNTTSLEKPAKSGALGRLFSWNKHH